MRLEFLLNGSLEECEEFSSQDYRLSLCGEHELRIEVVGSEMELFIELSDLEQAVGMLKQGMATKSKPQFVNLLGDTETAAMALYGGEQ